MSAPLDTLAISPAARDALQTWLEQQRAPKGAADNTLTAYSGDVTEFLAFMSVHHGGTEGLGALAKITVSDMRSWMARTRSEDVGPRSLARKLSAVKAFYRWLAEREGFEPTAVLSTRSPKFTKKLPRPLAIDAAQELISCVEDQAREPWIAARDVAVLTLLWGCGLRISEALGLKGADAPLPDVLRIVGKGGKERVVPVLPAARDAVGAYLRTCPYGAEANGPLFRGVRGGALSAGAIQKVMASARMQLGLSTNARIRVPERFTIAPSAMICETTP